MTLAEMTTLQQAKFINVWIKRLTTLSEEVKFDFLNPGKMDRMTSIYNRLVKGIENYGEKAFGLTEKQIAFVEDTLNDELKFLTSKKRAKEVEATRKAELQAVAEAPVKTATETPAAPRSQIDWERLDTMTGDEIHGFDKDEWDASVAEFEAEYPGDSFLEELKVLPFPPTSETRRLSVTIPENLYYEVEVYRLEHDLQNWTQALVEVAANALGVKVRLPERGGARPGTGPKPGGKMDHNAVFTAYLKFWHVTSKANDIEASKPIIVALETLNQADRKLFPDRESLIEVVAGAVMDACDAREKLADVMAFSEEFVGGLPQSWLNDPSQFAPRNRSDTKPNNAALLISTYAQMARTYVREHGNEN